MHLNICRAVLASRGDLAAVPDRPPRGLLRRYLHACCDQRTIGGHGTAAGCRPLTGNDRGVASDSAICGQEQLVLSALHAAIRGVAIRSNDPNAECGAGRTGIAFRARGPRRPCIALGPLTLTATHHCAGQRHRNEHSQHTHGLRSKEGATGCPISRSRKRPIGRASRQNAVGGRGSASYKYPDRLGIASPSSPPKR